MSRLTRFILALFAVSLLVFSDLWAATPPSVQARFIGVNNIQDTQMDVSFVKGNGIGRIVVVSTDATIDQPVNGTAYDDVNGNYTDATIDVLSGGDKVVAVLTGGSSSTQITNLAAGTTYYIQVFAYNTGGSPSPAYNTGTGLVNPRSATTKLVVNPPTIGTPTITATTVSFGLTDNNSTSDGYLLTLNYDGGANISPYDELDITTPTSFEITDLTQGTAYDLYIKAYIGNTISPDSTWLDFTTPVDNTAPQISSIAISKGLLYSADAGDPVTFTITFNEAMKTWETPAIVFSSTPTGLNFVTGSWDNDGVVYTAEYSIADEDEEGFNNVDVSVTTTSIHDLAGNDLSTTNNPVADVFSLDTKEGVLSNFNYDQGILTGQSHCKSGVNEDVVQFEIDLSELGYNATQVGKSNFNVYAEDVANTVQIPFTTTDSTNSGTYLFSDTLSSSYPEDDYNLIIVFTDEAGNEIVNVDHISLFRIDNTDPTITDVSLDNECVNENDVITLTFKAADTGGCGEFDENDISISNTATTDNSWGFVSKSGDLFTYTLNATVSDDDASYLVTITATDDAGNEATDVSETFSVDKTEPVISNLSVTTSCLKDGTDNLEFTFEVVEDGCGTFDENDLTVGTGLADATPTITSTGSGTVTEPYIFTYKYSINSVGGDVDDDYNITIDATDDAGNATTQFVGTSAFTIDNTAPAISNVSLGNTCVNGDDIITLTFTATDGGCGTFDKNDISISNTATTDNGWVFVSSGDNIFTYTLDVTGTDDDGSYTVNITATDDAGNQSTDNSATFTVDNTAPAVTDVAVDETCANGGTTLTLTFTVVEGGCGTFDAGNITINDDVTTTNSWSSPTVSGTAPNFTVSSTLLLTAGDASATADVTIDVTDDAGNSSTNNGDGDVDFTIDNTAPVVAITDPVLNADVNGTKVIAFTVTEDGCGSAVTEASVDGTNWTVITSGTSTLADITGFAGLSDGAVSLQLQTTDGAGNVGTTSVSINKDATAPTVTSITVSDAQISIADAGTLFTVTVNFNEEMDQSTTPTVTISTNNTVGTTNSGGTWSDGDSYVANFDNISIATPEAIENLGITVSGARDDAEDTGNLMAEDNTTGADAFDIDTEAPTISFDNGTFLSPADGSCVSGDEPIYFTADDESTFSGLASVQAKFAAGTYATFASGSDLSTVDGWSGAAPGLGILHLLATDDFGNTAEITRNLHKDVTAPIISNLTVTPLCANAGEAITIAFDVDEAGCGTFNGDDVELSGLPTGGTLSGPTITEPLLLHFEYTYTIGSGDANGDYTVVVDATDDAGNAATQATASSPFSVDKQGPTLSNLVTESTAGGTPTRVGGTTTTLTIKFDVASDATCSTFDANSVVYTITGPKALTNTPSAPTQEDADTWSTTLTITSADSSGDYHISVAAADGLGNASNTLDPAGVEFVVDNTAPALNSITAVPDSLNRADDGTGTFYIEFYYNEEMDTNPVNNPTYSFPVANKKPDQIYPPASVAALTLSSPQPLGAGWQADNRHFRIYFDVENSSDLDMRNILVGASGGKDLVGNAAASTQQSNVFSIDMITPHLSEVEADPQLVTNNTATVDIIFTFDEDMDIDYGEPTITFPINAGVGSAITINETSSDWFSSTVYKATYNVTANSNVEETSIQVKIENARDKFGNPFDPTPNSGVFTIDTKAPACAVVTTDPSTVNVMSTALSFDVSVQMDQALDNSVTPTISFGGNTNLSASGGTYSTITNSNDTYTFTVTHDGTEEDIDAQSVIISGLKDLSGNVQVDPCSTSVNIDTDKPDITSVAVSDDFICTGDNGGTETVTITFDEAMNTSIAPTITFDADLVDDGILTFSSGSWNGAGTVYTANYTISTSSNYVALEADVWVATAEDLIGNVMDTDGTHGEDLIDVDAQLPHIESIAFNEIPDNSYGVNRSNIGTGGFEVVFEYSEEMNTSFAPTIEFTPNIQGGTGLVGSALSFAGGAWSNGNKNYTATYNVNDAEVHQENIIATISGGKDLCGNEQESENSDELSSPVTFNIDLIAPSCSTMTNSNPAIYENDKSVTVSILFSEDMSSSVNPTFLVNGTTQLTSGTATWSGDMYFEQQFTHTGVEEETTATFSIDATAALPTDLAGNPMATPSCSTDVDIDTKKPTVTSVSFSPAIINENTTSFDITVVFSEDMSSSAVPGIGLNHSMPGLLSPNGYTQSPNNTFVFHYNVVADIDSSVNDITIAISNGQDIAGNVMLSDSSISSFDVDQISPEVIDVTFSNGSGWINRGDIGADNFTLTIQYDEAMNSSIAPTVAIDQVNGGVSPEVYDAITNGSGAWSTTTNTNDTYTITYDVVDVAVGYENVGVTISGAQDVAGNTQDTKETDSEGDGAINIDLVNPTIEFSETIDDGSCVNGDETISYTTDDNYSVDDVDARIGSGLFTAFSSGDNLSTISGWSAAAEGTITLELKAIDYAGNEATVSRNFNKDVTAPVISNIQKEPLGRNCVGVGDYYYFDFTATDIDGCGTLDQSDITITETLTNDFEFVSKTGNEYRYKILISASDAGGNYDYHIIATDDAGNSVDVNPPGFDIYIDKVTPIVTNIQVTSSTCVGGDSTVTLTFDVSDESYCGIDENNTTINTSPSTENSWTYVSGSGNGTYTYTLLVDNNDPSGAVDVTIDVTDVAGNASTGNGSGNTDFTIDNTAPVFSNFSSESEGTACLAGGSTYYFSVDVVENGCATFDENNITVTVNGSVANSVVPNGTNPTGSGTYNFMLDISNSDVDGLYNISFDATDGSGNVATTYSPAGDEFRVDNTAPVIAITGAVSGDSVNSTKAIGYTADDGSGCGIDDVVFSVDNSNWIFLGSLSTLDDIPEFSGIPDGPFTLYLYALDNAGNDTTVQISLVKDTQAPTVTAATPSDAMLSIADNGSAFSIDITFSEAMDQTVAPAVTLTSNNTVATTNTGGSWTGTRVYNATFGNVNVSTPEEIANLDVTVSGARDNTEDIGNSMSTQTVNDVFDIDTKAPTCSTMTNNNPTPIYENDKSVTVSVLFSEAMSNSINPTFLVSGTTQFTTGSTNWSGSLFTQQFTHTGVQEETTAHFEIDDTAPLPTDLAGNTLLTPSCTTAVDIDTKKPTVTSVSFSPVTVTESTTHLYVTVVFDEDMNPANPGVAFNTSLPGLLTYNSYTTPDSKTFVYDYSTTDVNLDVDDVTVTIANGHDVAGNIMNSYVSTSSFDVDQVAPTITAAHIESDNGTNNQYAKIGNFIEVILTPSEELSTSDFTGTIAGYSILSVENDYSIDGTYTLTVEVDGSATEGVATFSIGYKDLNGNSGTLLTSVTDGSSVTIDLTKPVATIALASGQDDPTGDSPVNFAVTFGENVTGFVNSDIAISGTAGATTATVTGSGSTYNVAVSGMTGSGTVIINLDIDKVTDLAGNGNATTSISDNEVQYNVSGASIVEAGAGSEPTTLSSLVDTQGEAVLNFDFKVTDDGTNPGADLLATKITGITINQGTGNDITYLDSVLAGAVITDGTNTVTGSVYGTTISFTGLATGSGQIGEVADNASKTYTLKVWLRNDINVPIDNENLAFSVNRSSFATDGSGSSFSSGAGPDVESGATNNAIDVDATEFGFPTTPSTVEVNVGAEFVVQAQDANGNKDEDYSAATVTLTPDQSTISSGGSGAMSNGSLTLSSVVFSVTASNDYVTASDGTLSGNSATFNIREQAPSAITNLAIVPNRFSFAISWTNPDGKNTLILAKKGVSSYTYTDETNMDATTTWSADLTYGSSATPDDNTAYVIYAGNATSITMSGLINGKKEYAVTAYAYAGTLNSSTQNFNENETSISAKTKPKDVEYSDDIKDGFRFGIDNVTPQPANLNGNISLQIETINDMQLTLELYDSKGQKMMTIFDGKMFEAGETNINFNLLNTISSGQHFLRLTGNGQVVIAPLTIVK